MTIDADNGRCAKRPPCTAIAADSAAARFRAALLHRMALATRLGDVAYLRASGASRRWCRRTATVEAASQPMRSSRSFRTPFRPPYWAGG